MSVLPSPFCELHQEILVPRLSYFRIEFHVPQNEINPSHFIPEILRVREDVGTLLVVHARDAIPAKMSEMASMPQGAMGLPNRRLAWSRRANGVVGSVMVLHALGTSTSRIALRVTLFRLDLEPSVATSLAEVSIGK
jgi:hypothetical protein